MNPFQFHTGLTYEETTSGQLKGDCIFCGKEKKFFIDTSSWQWDCKVCMKKGNLYTFLQQFHALLLPEPARLLADERGIPYKYFENNKIRLNQYQSSSTYHVYVLPTYNKDGQLNNLYKIIPNRDKPGKRIIMCTPSLSSTLFNFPMSTHQTVWLLEGHWDKLAAEAIVEPRPITCIGWPGSAFKPSWASVFSGKDLCIFQDKDEAGTGELQRIMKHIESTSYRPKSIRVAHWPEDAPAKFDVNDALKVHGPGAFNFLEGCLREYETPSLALDHPVIYADESCDSFEKLLSECENTLYFTKDMELLLLAMITSLYSLKIQGEQIWLRVMGPPGSSKTTVAKLLGSSERTVMRDTFTGILSGWKDEQQQDASMIPMIADKALIVKDADALMQQPNFLQIMAEMRAFYDKDIAVTYRHRLDYDYQNIRSSFIFCGTHTLRGMDDTSLGERFLDYELHVTQADRDAISNRVLTNSINSATSGKSYEDDIKTKAKGFIDNHLLLRNGVATLGDRERFAIQQSGSLISYMRAQVKRDYKGKIKYKPHPEVPSRIVGQLAKVFLCAPIIFNTQSVPSNVHSLVRHITRDIIDIDSLRYRLCNYLNFQPESTGEQLTKFLHPTPPEIIAREIENMSELNMVNIITKRTSTQHMINCFSLKPHIQAQFQLIASDD